MTELAPPNLATMEENPVSPLLEMMDLNDESNSNSNQSLPDQNTRLVFKQSNFISNGSYLAKVLNLFQKNFERSG